MILIYLLHGLPASEQKTIENLLGPTPTTTPDSSDEQYRQVTRIVDGDTFVIAGGQKVRYIGIDTPETVDPHRPVMCFGEKASEENKKLILGKQVRLVKDVSETDKYGRLLRYVYLPDGTFVNKLLVEQGYAKAVSYPPDIAYQDVFRKAEEDARAQSRGLWGSCALSPTPALQDNNSAGQAATPAL